MYYTVIRLMVKYLYPKECPQIQENANTKKHVNMKQVLAKKQILTTFPY